MFRLLYPAPAGGSKSHSLCKILSESHHTSTPSHKFEIRISKLEINSNDQNTNDENFNSMLKSNCFEF